MKTIHISPRNDLIEHNVGKFNDEYSCMCNPEFRIDWDRMECTIIHDAMDGRPPAPIKKNLDEGSER